MADDVLVLRDVPQSQRMIGVMALALLPLAWFADGIGATDLSSNHVRFGLALFAALAVVCLATPVTTVRFSQTDNSVTITSRGLFRRAARSISRRDVIRVAAYDREHALRDKPFWQRVLLGRDGPSHQPVLVLRSGERVPLAARRFTESTATQLVRDVQIALDRD